MKSNVWSVFLVVCACLTMDATIQAQTYDVEKNPYVEGVSRELVTAYEHSVSLDEALILIGRSASVDIIADATDFTPEVQIQPFPATQVARDAKWKNSLGNVVADLMEQGDLSYLRFTDRTLLFWREPDLVPLAREIIANGQLGSVPQFPLPAKSTYALAAEIARKSHNWDGKEPFVLETSFSQLSPGMRDNLELFRKSRASVSQYGLDKWLADSFWERARLVVKQVKGNHVGDVNQNAKHTVMTIRSFDTEGNPLEANYGLFLEMK